MAVHQIIDTTDAQLQIWKYNRGSKMWRHATYAPSAGTPWAIVALKLAAAVQLSDVPTIVAGIEATDEVTGVASPQIWGVTPDSILINPGGEDPDTHALYAVVEVDTRCVVGVGTDTFENEDTRKEQQVLPLSSKILICNLVLPLSLTTQQGITDLESAIEAVTGIQKCEHIIHGTIENGSQDVQMNISTRFNILEVE